MRSPQDKVIITCAVTGNLTTPDQTPHLPITPRQIADACLGAADAGADVAVGQAKAVVAASRGGLVGVAGAVQGGEEPVAGAVAGEDAAGAVAAVGRRRQADDEQPRPRVAEAGDGKAPVVLILVGGALLAGHLLAPGHQPRTGTTGDDAGV